MKGYSFFFQYPHKFLFTGNRKHVGFEKAGWQARSYACMVRTGNETLHLVGLALGAVLEFPPLSFLVVSGAEVLRVHLPVSLFLVLQGIGGDCFVFWRVMSLPFILVVGKFLSTWRVDKA